MTEQIKKKLQDEINALEHELHNELPKELKKAIALGDLSENAEYHMAKQRQEILRARLEGLKHRLHSLAMVDVTRIPKDRAALGSILVLYDTQKESEIEYRLVTTEESDVTK